MTELAQKIHNLRKQNKSFRQIASLLGCSRGTVAYYLGNGTKQKTIDRIAKWRQVVHPYTRKIERFCKRRQPPIIKSKTGNFRQILTSKIILFSIKNTGLKYKMNFTVQQVLDKFGPNPKCYLTGRSLDITKPRTYQFDHIIPASRGGDNSLDNLGICTREANLSKRDMTPNEFFQFCKEVISYQESLTQQVKDGLV